MTERLFGNQTGTWSQIYDAVGAAARRDEE
jgi:hypothetical protein